MKLTKTQAEILTNLANGWRLLHCVGGFIFADGKLTRKVPTVSVQKLIDNGLVAVGDRMHTGNCPVTLTEAGRAALPSVATNGDNP